MTSDLAHQVNRAYRKNFAASPVVQIRAPGRINLIGEHTDYNNGFVLPAAVSQSIYFAIGKSNQKDRCSLISLDYSQTYNFSLTDLPRLPAGSWQNYILGVVDEIVKSGRKLEGFNIVFGGDIPQGSGMSSSAALECGACFGLNELFQLNIPKLEMVKMSQMAEHNYARVQCGIMDQFASMMGKTGQAFRLDCQSLDYDYFPLDLKEYSLMLCNSNVEHNLASSEYNVRRQQCEEGVSILQKHYPEIHSLRNATLENLDVIANELSDIIYQRCRYIIEENQRVIAFSEALSVFNLLKAGEILKEAQQGMKNNYEITCPEIDFMADFANSRKDVAGARMMGGGFGGCTLNLIRKGSEASFAVELNKAYKEKFQKEITPIAIQIAEGVSLIETE